MKSTTIYSGGTSICSLLTLLFVALKLCDKIDWSWWWVLSPLWIPWAIAFVVTGALGVIMVAAKVIVRLYSRR